jgi:O-antigen ligase
MAELWVELISLLSLGIWLCAPAAPGAANPPDRALWIGVALFVAVPILQLVPLPPALWHALPGRENEIAALNLIGADQSWRPISVAPYMTLSSLLSLIPPLIVLFLVSRSSLQGRVRILAVIAAVGIAAGLIGMLQVASGNARWFLLYPHQTPRFAAGFQANRNAGADVFLISIIAMAGYCAARRTLIKDLIGKLLLAAFIFLLVLTTVLSGSRAGSVLILIPLALAAALLFGNDLIDRRTTTIGAVVVIALLGLAAMTWNNPQLDRTWSRYADQSEARPELWRDTVFAIKQTAPIGSGLGTFVPVIAAAERLEVVDTTSPNRAHNDYLEFALETGIAGAILVIGLIVALGARGYRILRATSSKRQRVQAICGLGILIVLGLHSIVDYPMRSMAVAGLAAVGIGFLSRVAVGRGEVRDSV